jgi:hypothetical protein
MFAICQRMLVQLVYSLQQHPQVLSSNPGWGEFQAGVKKIPLAAVVRVRGVFSVGDWESSPVKSGLACGPCVCALSAARPRSGRRLIPWGAEGGLYPTGRVFFILFYFYVCNLYTAAT